MKLWHLMQNEVRGYDTYDSAVVVAETEDAAKLIHPDGHSDLTQQGIYPCWAVSPLDVVAIELGDALNREAGVVCASFNAG